MAKIWYTSELTGSGARVLQEIDISSLSDGDISICQTSAGILYFHTFDSSSTDATSSPSRIRPTTYTTSGVWCEGVFSASSVAAYSTNEIIGGDITVSGNVLTVTQYQCLDSDRTVELETLVDKNVTIPTVANTIYHVFAVKLAADGSHEIRAYTTTTGVASDSDVSAYRRLDYWLTDGSGNCLDGYSIAGEHYTTKASESAVNALTSSPASLTVIDLSSYIPDDGFVSHVLLGIHSTSTSDYAAFGFDGTNVFTIAQHNTTYDGDDEGYAWGLTNNKWMPLKNAANIYWRLGGITSTTCQVLLQATKLRR